MYIKKLRMIILSAVKNIRNSCTSKLPLFYVAPKYIISNIFVFKHLFTHVYDLPFSSSRYTFLSIETSVVFFNSISTSFLIISFSFRRLSKFFMLYSSCGVLIWQSITSPIHLPLLSQIKVAFLCVSIQKYSKVNDPFSSLATLLVDPAAIQLIECRIKKDIDILLSISVASLSVALLTDSLDNELEIHPSVWILESKYCIYYTLIW